MLLSMLEERRLAIILFSLYGGISISAATWIWQLSYMLMHLTQVKQKIIKIIKKMHHARFIKLRNVVSVPLH